MQVFAHRGCPDRGPENTVAAVRRAAPHVDAVEVDVRRCASGELVVFHDETLPGVLSRPDGSAASGRLGATDWTDLSTLRVGDSEEPVARFREMVAAVDDAGLGLNVELKESDLATDVADALEDFGGDVLVSSFDPDALYEMRAAAGYPVAPLVDSGLVGAGAAGPWSIGAKVASSGILGAGARTWNRALEVAADLDAAAIHPAYDLLLRAGDPAARVESAHAMGLAVNAWTVRREDPVPALRAAGVDGLIVDDWAVVG